MHDDNRVIGFQRWVEGAGRDVVVVVSLNESTYWSYAARLSRPGPLARGLQQRRLRQLGQPDRRGQRRQGSTPTGGPMHGLPCSAAIVIPANGFVVFARDRGD